MIINKNDVSGNVLALYTVPNSKYYDLIKLGNETWGCKKTVSLISKKGACPPSALYYSATKDNTILYPTAFVTGGLVYDNDTLELRPEQVVPAKKLLEVRVALLEAPPGFGKTIMSSELLRKTKLSTLVVCSTLDIMRQFQATFKDHLGIDCGVFCGTKKELKNVTVTTYASAKKNFEKLNSFGFKMLHIDEADLFVSPPCLEFLNNFDANRKYGFTATPKIEKTDDLLKDSESLMDRIWGYRVVVPSKKNNTLKSIILNTYEETYYENIDGVKIEIPPREWHDFRRELDSDMSRKAAQVKWVDSNHKDGDFSLVLLDRVSDVEYFYEIFTKNRANVVYYLHGSVKKKEREETIKNFKKTGGILVANIKIAGRGFDVPECNKAFLCCPLRGESSLRQAVGRIERVLKDKSSIMFDWVDSSLKKQAKKRMKVYSEYFPKAIIKNS